MIKYIMVTWPEIQEYMHHPRWEECIFCSSLRNHPCPDSAYMVPEDLYEEITNPLFKLPDEYSNYTMDFDKIKKGQNCLVAIGNSPKYTVVKAAVNWDLRGVLPLILEDTSLLDGFNCEVIAVENGNL